MACARSNSWILALLFSILALLTVTSPATAELVPWCVSAELDDGGHVTGTFMSDTMNPIATIASWSIEVQTVALPIIPITNPFVFSNEKPNSYAQVARVGWPGVWATKFEFYTWCGVEPKQDDGYDHYLFLYVPAVLPFGAEASPLVLLTGIVPPGMYLSRYEVIDIPHVIGGGLISNGTITAVPIPPSSLLFGAGLIGLAWARRKQRLGR